MEFVSGETICDDETWRKTSWQKKEELARQLAGFQAQLHQKKFPSIGSLQHPGELKDESSSTGTYILLSLLSILLLFIPSVALILVLCVIIRSSKSSVSPLRIGRISSMDLVLYGSQELPRGPHRNAHQWLHAP